MTMKDDSFSIDRRELLLGTAGVVGLGALAAATGMGSISEAVAAEEHRHGAGEHQHGRKHQAMTDAMMDCVKKGNACIAHCLDLIKGGDTSIIDCLRSVQETTAFCSAHAYLSAADSRHLDAMCKLAIQMRRLPEGMREACQEAC